MVKINNAFYFLHYRLHNLLDSAYKSSGIGGASIDKALVLTDFPLLIGDHCVIPSINVIISESTYYTSMLPIVDGTLGQNIIGLYDRMIIDLTTMTVILKK